MKTSLKRAFSFGTLLLTLCQRGHAESVYEVTEEIGSTLKQSGMTPAKKIEKLTPLLSHADSEAKALGCFALAVLGEKGVGRQAEALLADANYKAAIAAAFCLASVNGAASAPKLIPLLSHKEESVRNEVGKLLAQFKNNETVAGALKTFLQQEKESHVRFNALAQMRGWTLPSAVTFLAEYLEQEVTKKNSVNADAIGAILSDVSQENGQALRTLSAFFKKPEGFPGRLMSLARATEPPPLKKGSEKVLALLEQKLSDRKTGSVDRAVIAEVIGTYRSPKSVTALEKGLGPCEDSDCEAIAWTTAEQGKTLSQPVIKKALKHSSKYVTDSVKGIGIYQAAEDKNALITGVMQRFSAQQKTTSFDSVDRITKLLGLASCDGSGISRETLEMVIVTYKSTFPLPEAKMAKCYVTRFHRDTAGVANFAIQLPEHSVFADHLVDGLQTSPSTEGCQALTQRLARQFNFHGKWDAALPLISLRLAGKC